MLKEGIHEFEINGRKGKYLVQIYEGIEIPHQSGKRFQVRLFSPPESQVNLVEGLPKELNHICKKYKVPKNEVWVFAIIQSDFVHTYTFDQTSWNLGKPIRESDVDSYLTVYGFI